MISVNEEVANEMRKQEEFTEKAILEQLKLLSYSYRDLKKRLDKDEHLIYPEEISREIVTAHYLMGRLMGIRALMNQFGLMKDREE